MYTVYVLLFRVGGYLCVAVVRGEMQGTRALGDGAILRAYGGVYVAPEVDQRAEALGVAALARVVQGREAVLVNRLRVRPKILHQQETANRQPEAANRQQETTDRCNAKALPRPVLLLLDFRMGEYRQVAELSKGEASPNVEGVVRCLVFGGSRCRVAQIFRRILAEGRHG